MKFFCNILFFSIILSFLGACSYTVKIEDGKTAYDRKQFSVAIPMLKKELNRAKLRSEKARIAYLLADAYRRTGQDEQALEWFQYAADNNGGAEALKGHAYTLKKMERYSEAADAFKNLGVEIGSPYEYRKELTACTIAAEWKRLQAYSGYTVAPAPFNSPQNDFAPSFYADGQLVFTSDRAGTGDKNDAYAWTGNRFMDLFLVDNDESSPQHFDLALNTKSNEGTACFNSSFTEVFFVRAVGAYKGDDAFCKIYTARKDPDTGGWGNAAPLPFQKEKINYVHPVLSADGATLYFSCNDPDGWGGFDIYAVQRSNKTESGWDDPRVLSRSVNTTGNELFPSVDADTLYFASDGQQGMGGLDIFRTWKSERTAWAPPQNLKSPVNSGADDFAFIVDPRSVKKNAAGSKVGDLLRSGYFTSNRSGGRGFDDIYRFEQRVPPPLPVKKDTTPAVSATAFKLVLEGYVLEKIFSSPGDPNSTVLGRRPLDGASVQIEFGGKKQQVKVKEDGFFTLVLNENTDYQFVASQTDYLSNSARFSTKGIAKDPANPVQTFEIEIVLDKIYRDKEIVLENIYYDYDKWDIRPDAEPTLNKLSEVLRQNPAIRIQLGSHTDCRGNDGYNQDLSQKRAQSAVNYLINKGIDPNRLSALGYGEGQPAADCACNRCTETEHQTNRRTTFKIID